MYRLSLATFVFIVGCLSMAFVSVPAFAGGAGGSWGCPDGWTEKPDGSCGFGGGGGSTGGGGAGGSWDDRLCFGAYGGMDQVTRKTPKQVGADTCAFLKAGSFSSIGTGTTPSVYCQKPPAAPAFAGIAYCTPDQNPPPVCVPPQELINGVCSIPPPPDFPDIPPPDPDCNVCQSLYDIKLKINHLKNQDINNITNILNNMTSTVNNIDNSINDLSVNQQITNNNLTMIDNSIGDLITNIENNDITNNEIKNIVNKIDNSMTDYSLQLGDIKLALGDIDLSLKNTNKLVLDLRPDIDFIKNKLVNGGEGDSKDYTEQLNQIIALLAKCVPDETNTCPDGSIYDDTELIALLTDIKDFMQADFEPGIDDNTVSVTDLTDVELDRDLIKFGVAQCPPDNEFNTMVNGFSFSGGFKHKPLCDFFTLLAPFIKAFGGFSAALILGGGLRR